jgi:hypothetical protein
MQLRWLIKRYEYEIWDSRARESVKHESDSHPMLQYRWDHGGEWFDVPTEVEVSTEEERRAKHERQEIVECRA